MKAYKVTYKVNENGGVFKHQVSFKRYFSSLKKAKNSIQDEYKIYGFEPPIFEKSKNLDSLYVISNINDFSETGADSFADNIEIIEIL